MQLKTYVIPWNINYYFPDSLLEYNSGPGKFEKVIKSCFHQKTKLSLPLQKHELYCGKANRY